MTTVSFVRPLASIATNALLAVVLLSGGCTNSPDMFSEESARIIADSLAEIRAREQSVGVTDFCASLGAWEPSTKDPPVVRSVGEHVARFLRAHAGFSSCAVRSAVHTHRFPGLMRLDAARDIVVWRDGPDGGMSTVHVVLVHGHEAPSAGDGEGLNGVWPVAVGLEALRAFSAQHGSTSSFVVTVADRSEWSGDRATTWPDSLPATSLGAYSSRFVVSADGGPVTPISLPVVAGWVVGRTSPDGRPLMVLSDTRTSAGLADSIPAATHVTPPSAVGSTPVAVAVLRSEPWLVGDEVVPSTIRERGNALLGLLRSAAGAQASRSSAWSIDGHMYWLAGILIPVLLAVVAVMKITIRLASRRSNVKRAIRKLERWNVRVARAEDYNESQVGIKRYWAKLWLFVFIVAFRRKYLNKRVRDAKKTDFDYLQKRAEALAEENEEQVSNDVRALFGGMMEGLSVVAHRAGAWAFALGILTSIVAFVVVQAVDVTATDLPDTGYGEAVIEHALLAAIVVFLAGLAVAAIPMLAGACLRRSVLAFAWGSSVLVFVGINTVELSARFRVSEIHNLYDSQTVSMAFIGVAMLLTICKIMDRRKSLQDEEKREWGVVTRYIRFAASGGRWEVAIRILLAVLYVLLVIHLVFPAGMELLRADQWLEGLLPVTVVTVVSLLIPVFILLVQPIWPGSAKKTDSSESLVTTAAAAFVGALLAGGCSGKPNPPPASEAKVASVRVDMRELEAGHVAYWLYDEEGVAVSNGGSVNTALISLSPVDRRDTVLSVTPNRRTVGTTLRDTTGAEMVAIWVPDHNTKMLRVDDSEVREPETLRVVERWSSLDGRETWTIVLEVDRCVRADLVSVRRYSGKTASALAEPILSGLGIASQRIYVEVLSRVEQHGPLPRCCS